MKRFVVGVGVALCACCGVASAQNNASQWDFNAGGLATSFGPGIMSYWDDPINGTPGQTAADTSFGTCSSFGIGLIGGVDAHVVKVLPYFGTEGLLVHHGAPGNGGGVYTNLYTIGFDVYVDNDSYTNGSGWLPFHNTNATNANDADCYVQFGVGIGIDGIYDGTFNPDTWYRIVFVFDVVDPATSTLSKYIDGALVGTQTLDGVDGRWSLYNTTDGDLDVEDIFYLFTEPEGLYTAQAYYNSVFFVDRALSGAEVAALGGADADGIGPLPAACPCDVDGSGAVNSADFFAFLTAFFNSDPSADFDHSGAVNSADFFAFLTCFFSLPTGCN